MSNRQPLPCVCLLIVAAAIGRPSSARADWEDGRVPEGDSAFTVPRHMLRLGLVGRSAVGLTGRLELSTHLPLDLLLFPNLALKYRFVDGERIASAIKLGAGGGAYPVLVGAVMGFVPLGFLGLVGGAYEQAQIDVTLHPSRPLALTLRGGVLATQVGVVGTGGAAARGAVVFPVLGGGSAVAATGGVEADWALGDQDALVLEGDIYAFHEASQELVTASLVWTHALGVWHVSVGAWTLMAVPGGDAVTDRSIVLPYANVYWTF
jgi:hypothetical protein